MAKIFLVLIVVLLAMASRASPVDNYSEHDILDIETPNFFTYNSPLRQPDSLKSRPYFDFLSTLYRRDATKSDLFRPYSYSRKRREVGDAAPKPAAEQEVRQKRAIVFRPLFVYKQQEVRKQQIQAERSKRL